MIVKCDECKVTIKEDVTEKESIEGGRCKKCRGESPSSFLTAIIRRLECFQVSV